MSHQVSLGFTEQDHQIVEQVISHQYSSLTQDVLKVAERWRETINDPSNRNKPIYPATIKALFDSGALSWKDCVIEVASCVKNLFCDIYHRRDIYVESDRQRLKRVLQEDQKIAVLMKAKEDFITKMAKRLECIEELGDDNTIALQALLIDVATDLCFMMARYQCSPLSYRMMARQELENAVEMSNELVQKLTVEQKRQLDTSWITELQGKVWFMDDLNKHITHTVNNMDMQLSSEAAREGFGVAPYIQCGQQQMNANKSTKAALIQKHVDKLKDPLQQVNCAKQRYQASLRLLQCATKYPQWCPSTTVERWINNILADQIM